MFVLDLGVDVPDFVLISVSQKGYVKRGITLRGLGREMLPKTVRLTLEEGVTIGAVVQDSEGRPVERAIVKLDFCEQKPSDEPWSAVHIEEKTDAQGQWRAANVPQNVESLWFDVRHPDFADSSFGMPAQLRMDDLRAERAIMTLDKGFSLVGRVTDAAGMPVAGANVLTGDGSLSRKTQTDAQGWFEFPHLSRARFMMLPLLTVQAPGFASQLRRLSVDETVAPVEFVLTPARLLIGRVVDSAGKPVEDAQVRSGEWKDYRTLQWESDTDAKGMFLWDSAPDDAVMIRITKPGCREIQRPVIADGRERTFILAKPTTIKGTVVDSETKEPVKRFRVAPGTRWQEGNQLSVWQPADSWGKWFTDGRYSFTFDGDGQAYAVRVEADGYLPFESRFVDANEVEAMIDVALTKGRGPSGYVFDANGAPVAGGEVFWGSVSGLPTRLVKDRAYAVYATTDHEGHFVFKPENRRDPFAVFCDQGMAVVAYEDLIRDGSITLTPWARVQGDLHAGTKPVVNKRLHLLYSLSGMMGTASTTFTDENGWFVLDRVYPGKFTFLDQEYEVSAGQTLELHLGGTGRTVKGELAMPETPDIPIRIDLILVPPSEWSLEGFPWPAGCEQMSFNELREWFTQFVRSPEGKALAAEREKMDKTYHFELDGNRTVRADNVGPGAYLLLGEIYRSEGSDEVLGRVWHELEVPPFKNVADLDVPLDLGTLAVVYGELKPGDPAPDFDVPASSAGRVRLADYRGKVLLVSLFNTGCMDPDSNDLQDLKAVHQRFSGNLRYAQVSLQLAWIALLDEKAVEEAHLDWPHGLLDERKDKVSTDYRLSRKTKPWNVLIGPQGQILAWACPARTGTGRRGGASGCSLRRSGQDCGFITRPRNRMLPEALSRIRKRNGWSARKTGVGSGLAEVTPHDCARGGGGFRAFFVDVHEGLVDHGRDEQVPLARHAGEVARPARTRRSCPWIAGCLHVELARHLELRHRDDHVLPASLAEPLGEFLGREILLEPADSVRFPSAAGSPSRAPRPRTASRARASYRSGRSRTWPAGSSWEPGPGRRRAA